MLYTRLPTTYSSTKAINTVGKVSTKAALVSRKHVVVFREDVKDDKDEQRNREEEEEALSILRRFFGLHAAILAPPPLFFFTFFVGVCVCVVGEEEMKITSKKYREKKTRRNYL